MKNQKATTDARRERRYLRRDVHPDRRTDDVDIIEDVIRDVRRKYEPATSPDQPLRRTPEAIRRAATL